jgi:hypothetical protein
MPEQINLQIAGPDVVVVGFVTYEAFKPRGPPVAVLDGKQLPGVAHFFQSPGYTYPGKPGAPHPARNYTMNFVKFGGLEPRRAYAYKVRSGAEDAAWSASFSFRAPYSSGVTRLAVYGDMGNSQFNNMGNLRVDCASGTVNAIVHMGDHCYDLGQADDKHGDAYMNAFQSTLAECPWLPVIGNHESYLGPGGDKAPLGTEQRYLNQTWGVAYGQAPAEGRSTATTALGHLLTKGTYYAAGLHGAAPSGTSRYNSVDIGLIHIVGLDLDPGQAVDGSSFWSMWNSTEPCAAPEACGASQGAWLAQDLAAADANRANVPWIIVTSHFPLTGTMLEANLAGSAARYVGRDGEAYTAEGDGHFGACPARDCATVGEVLRAQQEALIPLMQQYGVDVYDAGHVHSYEVSYPMRNRSGTAADAARPGVLDGRHGIVYITEGNGGVPGVVGKNSMLDCDFPCRKKGTGGAYGRFIAHNGSVLEYEHVENPTGNVSDAWALVK